MRTTPSHILRNQGLSVSAGVPLTSAHIMGSSLSNPVLRRYFIDAQLRRYVSEGTELVVVVENNFERDVLMLHVNVIRKDGTMVQLQSDLTLDDKNWPRVCDELKMQLMMVG